MEEESTQSKSTVKVISIIIILIIIFASMYVIAIYNKRQHQVALPHVKLNYTTNDTKTIREVVNIDYKYSIDYFRLENMLASVYTLESSENNSDIIEYGDYYHKGSLSDILNNETSPLTYYDVDNDSTLSVGDLFISDITKVTDEEIKSIGLSLWIVVDGEELSCGV